MPGLRLHGPSGRHRRDRLADLGAEAQPNNFAAEREDARPHARGRGSTRRDPAYPAAAPRRPPTMCSGVPCRCDDPEACPARASADARVRQKAGIATLISLASTAPTVAFPAIPVIHDMPAVADRSPPARYEQSRPAQSALQARGLLGSLRARLQTDHMIRNALYLILSSGLQAALGFAFWIVTARLFSTADIGQASSLISATVLLSFAALLGLNNTFVRYLPTAQNRDTLITAGFVLVAVCGGIFASVYVLLTPVMAPRLAFVEHNPALAVSFVLLTSAAAANLLTDSIFIAERKASFAALTDGGVGGVTKVATAVLFVSLGAFGVYSASVGGFAAAALVSVVLMMAMLRWRPSLRGAWPALKPLLRFSAASYAGNILNLIPILAVPLIVLDRLGASAAAYYFVAFQIATLLYSAAYAVSQSSLAEGSHSGVNRQKLFRRSGTVMMAMCVPACLVLIAVSHWVLLAFGTQYSKHAALPLVVLVVAAIPVALSSWLWTILRLTGQLSSIVLSSAVYGVGICALAWFLAPHGLTALTVAWPLGALLSVAVAVLSQFPRRRRQPTTRPARTPARPRPQRGIHRARAVTGPSSRPHLT